MEYKVTQANRKLYIWLQLLNVAKEAVNKGKYLLLLNLYKKTYLYID